MRICINAAAANQGGAITYLANLLPELPALEPGDRFLLIAPRDALDRLSPALSSPAVETEAYVHPPRRQARRLLFDQVSVPRLARRFRADLLFSANGFGTAASGCPEVLLVRNALYFCERLEERYRELRRSRRTLLLRRAWTRLSIRGAQAVVFPTLAMRDRVSAYVGLGGRRTAVLPYGFDRERFFSGERPDPAALAPTEQWRRAGRRVLLFVSGYSTHKNFETLVDALAELLARGEDVGLVSTATRRDLGELEPEFDALLARIRERGLESHVHWTGEIPWPRLHGVYAAADAFAFPSFLESFGHPMVEAMASGLPTAAADTSVNREILGDAAVFFDSFDVAACADAIHTCLAPGERRSALRAAGPARASHFSWGAHARGLRDLFRQVAGSGRNVF